MTCPGLENGLKLRSWVVACNRAVGWLGLGIRNRQTADMGVGPVIGMMGTGIRVEDLRIYETGWMI